MSCGFQFGRQTAPKSRSGRSVPYVREPPPVERSRLAGSWPRRVQAEVLSEHSRSMTQSQTPGRSSPSSFVARRSLVIGRSQSHLRISQPNETFSKLESGLRLCPVVVSGNGPEHCSILGRWLRDGASEHEAGKRSQMDSILGERRTPMTCRHPREDPLDGPAPEIDTSARYSTVPGRARLAPKRTTVQVKTGQRTGTYAIVDTLLVGPFKFASVHALNASDSGPPLSK